MNNFQIEKKQQTKAFVVYPNVLKQATQYAPESRLAEAVGLGKAINLDIIGSEVVNLKEIKAGNYFGEGYIEKIQNYLQKDNFDLLIVDSKLSPIQQRNLEKKLTIKVIDRTALILEIFGERAQSKEGKLQVELAHLTYQRSRLVRSWTHLERQRGGAGFLGGPGETQIELDRRIIDEKIIRIKKELEKVKKTRKLQRSARQRVPYPIVALVGYTNAGKSTLFNQLTQANVFAKDLLFATLDTTMRKTKLPSGQEIILSDTVGFISDLPHELIMAFRATLEEVLEADIIVHVRDISNPESRQQKKDVLDVLEHLGLKEIENKDNYIELLNKADLLNNEQKKYYQEWIENKEKIVLFSAITGQGIKKLSHLISEKLQKDETELKIKLPIAKGKEIAWIYKNSKVLNYEIKEDIIEITCQISNQNCAKLEKLLQKNKTVSL